MRLKYLLGILGAVCVLLSPINVKAYQPKHAIEVSYEDAQLLMKVAQAEAGNQGQVGQWLVMCVVLNRVESENFPNTVEEVIYQDGQFATASFLESVEPTVDSHLALAYLESGEKAKNIIAFEGVENSYLERFFLRAFAFRDHVFYTFE